MLGGILKNKFIIIYIFLAVATLTAFWQIKYCDFISFDDPKYVTENSHVRNGLNPDGIRWAFTTFHSSNWHPLTWISHMLDIQLFGLNPQWHHITNLLFHIANTLLLFFILHRMTKAAWKSAFVAALFALHPLHVESVVWVAERKDVLSAFFWMLILGAYSYYVEKPNLQRYLVVLLLFISGLMAKPMLVTLPFVLLLMDYWPLHRLGRGEAQQEVRTDSNQHVRSNQKRGKSGGKNTGIPPGELKPAKPSEANDQWALIRPLLWEKLPLLAAAALSSFITYTAQKTGGAVQSLKNISMTDRIANAFFSYVAYIGNMFWPHDLAVFYPYPAHWQLWQVLGALLIMIAVTAIVFWAAKTYRYLPAGWLWYIGTLVPVIGFLQVGSQAKADRYTYLPLIGLFIMAAWGIPDLMRKWRYRKEAFFTLSAVSLSCCLMVTWIQVGYWRDSLTLFNHALSVTKNNYIAYNSRGTAHYRMGNYEQAIADFDRAIEINPEFPSSFYNRGNTFATLGYREQALPDFDKAIEIYPKYAQAYTGRGNAYSVLGEREKAIENYDRAVEIDPDLAEAYVNRGIAYAILGKYDRALEDYNTAISIDPRMSAVYLNRAVTYKMMGNTKRVYEDLQTAAVLGNKAAQDFLRTQGIGW